MSNMEIPAWIELESEDVTRSFLHDLCYGGCASGMYMPAVTYSKAADTMAEHGDDVLQFIEDYLGEMPAPKLSESWSGIAVHYLSLAVELWAGAALQDWVDAVDPNDGFDDEYDASEWASNQAKFYVFCEDTDEFENTRVVLARKEGFDSKDDADKYCATVADSREPFVV